MLRKSEEEWVGQATSSYDDFAENLIKELNQLYSKVFRYGGTMNLMDYRRLQLDLASARIVGGLVPGLNQTVISTLEQATQEFYYDSYMMTAWSLDQTIPPNQELTLDQFITDETIKNPSFSAYAAQYLAGRWQGDRFSDRIGTINNWMARDIQTLTESAALNGWSMQELSQQIRGLVGISEDERLVTRPRAGRAKWRADMIARTELMQMTNNARNYLFEQNRDVIDEEVWSSAEDARTCPDCFERDGKTRQEIMEALGEEDQDLDIDPPAHPRCRCIWIPKLKSWSDLLGEDYGKGMDDLENVDEYQMKYFEPEFSKIVSMKTQPYEEWLKEAV